ncbi:MAG: flagellin [Caulobacterales bacterium]
MESIAMSSVNTNYGAMVALQSLNKTNRDLEVVQGRINTGLKVSSAKDDGAVFAIAEGMRNRVNTIMTVKDTINRANSVVETSIAAGTAIGDVLKQMKEKATAAAANDLTNDQRTALNADFVQLRDQVSRIVGAATFNGTNLINGTATAGIQVMMSDQGSTANVQRRNSDTAALGDILLSRGQVISDMVEDDGTTAGFDDATTADDSDFVRVTVGTGANEEVFNVVIDQGMTVGQFADAFSVATGGRVKASFNDATGQITYEGSTAFTLNLEEGDGGTDITGAGAAALLGTGATTGTAVNSAGIASTTPTTTTVSGFNFGLGVSGQALAGISATADITTQGNAQNLLAALDTAITGLNRDLATMGSQSRALEAQNNFLTKLSDSLEKGVGNLVDADLAKESARLQSLQIKQQLGAQALSIANQAPSLVLSLFR